MPRPVLTPLDGVAIIGTAELEDVAVTSVKLANDAVTQAKVADNAIGTAELLNNAVTTAKLLNGNVTAAKLDPAIDPSLLWQPVAYASGWGGDGVHLGLFVKKLYNIAWIAGTAFRSGGSSTIGTIPVGYRPVVATAVTGVEHSGAGASVVEISAAGVISAGVNVGQSFTIAGPYILF